MNDLPIQDDAPAAEDVVLPATPEPRRRLRRRLKAKAGYTLVEILVVLAIIAMLVGLAGPKFMQLQSGAKAKAASIEIKTLKSALDTMQLDIGRYPSPGENLSLLVQSPGDAVPNWRGPYIDKVPADPWGNPYVYMAPGDSGATEPQVLSYGEDGKPGGTGNAADITS